MPKETENSSSYVFSSHLIEQTTHSFVIQLLSSGTDYQGTDDGIPTGIQRPLLRGLNAQLGRKKVLMDTN